MAAAAVDRQFGCIYASFELSLKCGGMLSGPHCVSLGNLWRLFGAPWAVLERTLRHLGRSGSAFELLWGRLGIILRLAEKKVSAGTPIASR